MFQQSTNSALAKKVINSSTSKHLKKVANSSLGKEIQKGIVTGVTKASERAAESTFKNLGLELTKKRRKKTTPGKSKKKKVKGDGIILE